MAATRWLHPQTRTAARKESTVYGEDIDLSATPNSGWRVGGWTGTGNDASTASTNTVTMPASAHAGQRDLHKHSRDGYSHLAGRRYRPQLQSDLHLV